MANAAFVGANTVSFVLPDRAPTRPAFLTRLTSVENCGSLAATPTMFLLAAGFAEPDATVTGIAMAKAATTRSAMRFM